ncbi:MAG: hypothetical protein ACFFD4_12160 [Candidatus Odinarchaeota archaeon]
MIEQITERDLNELKEVARYSELKDEMKKLATEIEELKVRQEIEEKDLSQEIQASEKRIAEIKTELEGGLRVSHPFIELGEERKTNIKRMKTLQEKKGTISVAVFNRLKGEYEEKIKETEAKFQGEMAKMRELEVSSRDFKENIAEIKEEILVRKELGELTEEEYKQKTADLDSQKDKAVTVFRAVTTLIRMYE